MRALFFIASNCLLLLAFFGHLLDLYCHFCCSAWFGLFFSPLINGLSAFSAATSMRIGNTVIQYTHSHIQYTLALALFVGSFVLLCFVCCICFPFGTWYLFFLRFCSISELNSINEPFKALSQIRTHTFSPKWSV